MNTSVSFYLVAKYNPSGGWGRTVSVRTTKTKPSLMPSEVAIKMDMSLPLTLFERPALQATIAIPDNAVSKPEISAEVMDNIQEELEKQLGIDLSVAVLEHTEQGG